MIINCKITDTKLKSDAAQTTRLTKGYLYCKFEFLNPEDWAETEKYARFENVKSGVKRSAVIDDNGMCLVPWECLTTEGYLKFSAHGERADGYIINTDPCKTYLRDTIDGGEDSRPPTPNLYMQMLAERAKASESVMTVEQELTEEQQIQARKNIAAASAKDVSKLSEDIADLKENSTGGEVTDEQVSNAVNTWLDAHPEATTTVEDGSITEEKLHPNFVETLKKAKVNDEIYDTQSLGTLFECPDGYDYVTWCSNALQYDKSINKYVNLAWARSGHVNSDDTDTIFRVLINADTLIVEDISPLVMLDSDGVTNITTELMEGASFLILKDGTYVYNSYLDDTSTYKAYRYTSNDHGKTWVKDSNSLGIQSPYKARELSNGRILFSNTSKGFGICYSDDKLASATKATVEGGHGLAYGSYVSEWEFVELEENYIMAIGRKNGGGAGNEFSGDSDHALITYSTDNGTTWGQIIESRTIDNMNASNATSIVHGGIVEIFTTSRWYHSGNNTNSDHTATGKDGAMFHYIATIEEAKNDNFTNLGVVLYANGTNNSAQDFHAPCLALNTKTKDILIVYMDRMESNPSEENNNYHYVKGSLGKVCTKIDDKVVSPVFAYSNRKINEKLNKQNTLLQHNIDSLNSRLMERILTLEYALSQIEGSGVTTPEVPEGTVMWTKVYEATNGAIADSVIGEYATGNMSSDIEAQDTSGNIVRTIGGYNFIFPVTKENYAIEITHLNGEQVWNVYDKIGLTIDDSLNLYFAHISYYTIGFIDSKHIWDKKLHTGNVNDKVTHRMVKRGNSVTYTLVVNDTVIVENYDVTQHISWTPSTYNKGVIGTLTEECAFLNSNGEVSVYSIKFGEWD